MRKQSNIIIVVATLFFLVVSLPGLYIDVINPDGINWHNRSIKFINGLLTKHYSDTYQAYHPGISLMWISGPVLHQVESYFTSQGHISYSRSDFLTYDYAAKLSLITACTILFLISLLFLKNLINIPALIIFSLLMIFEPFSIGERRLYHLDFLMTSFIFTSFVCFYYYFFKSSRIWFLILGCLFFVGGVLTKSTAILFFPFAFIMAVFSREKILKRALALPLIIIITAILIFALFPALWKNPIERVPKYFNKIVTGVTDIGYNNKKELGSSGKSGNIILDDAKKPMPWYFYFQTIEYRFSNGADILLVLSSILILINLSKFVFSKGKKQGDHIWLGVFALIIFVVFFTALSIANKKSERYAIIFIPFLYLIIGQGLSVISKKSALVLSILIVLSLIPQYKEIYPYFHAYGNPLLGGVSAKYRVLQSSPFGVATYEAFQAVKEDRGKNTTMYTIAGTKSIKAISSGAIFSRSPNCYTDYFIAYAKELQPNFVCYKEKYTTVKVIKVGNMDYWYIYKRIIT